MTLDSLNFLVGIGTIAMQMAAILLLVIFFTKEKAIELLVVRFSFLISFLALTAGLVASLVYSECFGILPCGLCWLSRIFMYSQVVLFGTALWRREQTVAWYALVLSVLGFILSVYHHYIQMGGTSTIPCPATGAGDCAKRFLFEFGYITMPLTGASLFALISILMVFVIRAERHARG
jgi:disulfide bond formation protein DsbB